VIVVQPVRLSAKRGDWQVKNREIWLKIGYVMAWTGGKLSTTRQDNTHSSDITRCLVTGPSNWTFAKLGQDATQLSVRRRGMRGAWARDCPRVRKGVPDDGCHVLAKSGWCGENDVEQANQNVDTNQFLVDGLVRPMQRFRQCRG
jgi:hypothetical protein